MLIQLEDYDGYYIDDKGNVYSFKHKGCRVLKPMINQGGYLYVNLCQNGKYKSIAIHRLVGKYFIPNPNSYNVINHIDGNKLNNDVNNLEWCTIKYNVQEASRMGLLKPKKGGDSNFYSGKIDLNLANNIRCVFENESPSMGVNKTYLKLAKQYNVSKATIINIIKDRIYV